jgi:biopolymer transport protein ExbB
LIDFFRLGGIFMWPLLFFSLAALTVICDRVIFFASHSLNIDELVPPLKDALKNGTLADAARELEHKKNNFGASVLFILARPRDGDSLEKALQTEAENCVRQLEAGLGFLTAIGSLAPLTGFLGTVSGMIGAFRSISQAAEVNPQIVAGGIYEALITTVFGLVIAIASLSAYYILNSVVDRFAARTERVCSRFIMELSDTESARGLYTE